jgi:hypothetical protein
VKKILLPPETVTGLDLAKVSLSDPSGGELTGEATAYLAGLPPAQQPASTVLVPFGAPWKFLDDGSNQGTAWRNPNFNDSGWSNGIAELGFADGDESTIIRRTNSSGTIATFYFRKTVLLTNLSRFGSFQLSLLRDDAGVVYLNGIEVLRSSLLPSGELAYNFFTGGTAPPDNTIDTTNLAYTSNLFLNGTNVIAVEFINSPRLLQTRASIWSWRACLLQRSHYPALVFGAN